MKPESGQELMKRLDEAGLLPKNCYNVEIDLPVDDVARMAYYCYMTDEVVEALNRD